MKKLLVVLLLVPVLAFAQKTPQGVTTLDINGNTTGIVTYYCTGATVNDVFASTVYVI